MAEKTPTSHLPLPWRKGMTVRDAAKAADVCERTPHRRQAEPDFRRRVAELLSDMISRATGIMADAMASGASRLKELLHSPNDTVCPGAAKALLEMTVKLRDSVELQDRVTELEQLLADLTEQANTKEDAVDVTEARNAPEERRDLPRPVASLVMTASEYLAVALHLDLSDNRSRS
jgi:hypothetical protein